MRGYRQARDGRRRQGDPARLKQVIVNLLSNAIKYNRAHGTVRLGSTRAGDRLCCTVSDTGRGIASEHLPRLFQPFERLESSYDGIEGSGVGLALTRRLLEMMAGSIAVDSQVGVGSTFRFDLPLAPSPAETATGATRSMATPVAAVVDTAPPAADRQRRWRRILHVEDNPANLKLVRRLLGERPDVELADAGSGELGVALARATTPDLILLDLNLRARMGSPPWAGCRRTRQPRRYR
ncbi:MAG: Sensor histidine kinase RcsC [Accumulibacter sp.]|nr:MAG: Sensor histidine kinase RcsC [Accumulibacter sp.]